MNTDAYKYPNQNLDKCVPHYLYIRKMNIHEDELPGLTSYKIIMQAINIVEVIFRHAGSVFLSPR